MSAIAWLPCLQCGEPIRHRGQVGQPPRLHDDCRDEYKRAKDRARYYARKAAGAAPPQVKTAKICPVCCNLAHRREPGGCKGCGL